MATVGKIVAENLDQDEDNDTVTPWVVKTVSDKGIDYDKLIDNFGCQKITDDLVTKLENLTNKKAHIMLRRNLYFSHRDFNQILNRVEQKKPFFLYTGRGPSSGSLHLGHLVPFFFAKYLQETFDVPLVIQMTDDEKFLWKNLTFDEVKKMALNNIKDIISVGFDPKKTFIFTNTEYMCPAFYENVLKIWRVVTNNQSRSIFGFSGNDSMGKAAFPAIQAAPCFSSTFPQIFNSRKDIPCLIPCAIDQINKYAFSGGSETVELHRQLGGNCEIDTAYQFLKFFSDDDALLEEIRVKYTKGEMLSGELKKIAIECIQKLVSELQERRSKITDETVKEFTRVRKLEAFNY